MLTEGQQGSFSKIIAAEDIRIYANLTGDTNSLHLDEKAALAKGFQKRIAHGMLTGSLISTVLGTIFPGEGTVYLEQNLKFMKPAYEGEKVTAVVTVERVLRPEKGIYQLRTIVKNENGENVIEGHAVIKYLDTT